MKKKFYVTTAIDYMNAEPHIGHAYQKIIADVLARWHKIKGEEVFFLTGTDEHGQKIARSAEEKNQNPKEFVDLLAPKFENAWRLLNVDFDRFIRTTDKDHKKKVQEFIKLMDKKGDIYQGQYKGLYCEGCEAYITEKDLVNGRCKFHPNREVKELVEESYFFRLSKYEKKLLKFYDENKKYILPLFRRKEIINRVKEGLRDLNITRLKKNMSWGIDFPLDDKAVVYVWYEALLNYITGIGWPDDKKFKKFWPADVEILGIDNGWFHCVIWPAMLFSVGIKPPKTILINGFLTVDGQKISKSLGNVISPKFLAEKYSVDSIRYFVCRNFVFGQDGDFSEEKVIERHNNELADKLGNLISRVSALAEKYGLDKTENKLLKKLRLKEIEKHLDNYEFDKTLNEIFAFVDLCNEYVQNRKPWETKDKKVLYELSDSIKTIAILLWPFIPETCEKIAKQFGFKVGPNTLGEISKPIKLGKIKKSPILFEKIK
ncbi:MAG TPA: methionine--tRNA ligase [Candidatus Nanoarchaeia archaeon]|nr:methionine--tRNA ligase [Candidatus Nanoarchaeia archaeon]